MKTSGGRNADEFLAEAEEILESVSEDLLHLGAPGASDEPDPEVINSIFRGAHSLKGISGMFGFTQITEISHKMESLLDSLRMGRVACAPGVVDLLFEGVDLLKTLCGQIAEGNDASDPRCAPFAERLLVAAQGGGHQPPGGLSGLGLSEESVRLLTEYEVHRIEETLRSPNRQLACVRASFSLESFDTELESLNEAVRACGEIISTLPGASSSSGDLLDFELVVGVKGDTARLEEVAASLGATVTRLGLGPARSASASNAVAAPARGEAVAPEASRASPPLGAATLRARPSETEPRGQGDLRSLTKTIRVDLPKLDTLMNLVGELVLTKGRIQMVGEKLRDRMGFTGEAAELTKAQKEFERKLSDLQQAVMDVRMVPLGQIFSKLHRVMRKLLQNSPKEADLEIQGAETELDKLIVEDLSDPLIHVIRNAVDHGIEEPELRLSRGKPARGTVKVSARQRGNHVVIEVSDDGAGLAKERIRAKAIERGLIAEHDNLDDRELFDLVFVPGFSTKDEVTEVSGRGVGMDVLRKNIANLSGMIELSSVENKGTTVTIILPITLAIIQALLVEASESTYALPLNSVLETLSLERDQVKALEGRPVLHLRGQTLPLTRIDTLFGKPNGGDMPEYAVVIGVAEKRAAFAVDNLVSQRDVVIKSLGKRLRGLPGIAGATDLGDQRTVLLLDVVALVDQVFGAVQ